MSWFKKNKKSDATVEPSSPTHLPPCNHKWCDFDWYILYNFTYNNEERKSGNLEAIIYEPYVCCLCGKREDVQLVKYTSTYLPTEDMEKSIEEIKKEHEPHIKSKAEVEDQIADMQHRIDREYLQIITRCFPEKLGSINS